MSVGRGSPQRGISAAHPGPMRAVTYVRFSSNPAYGSIAQKWKGTSRRIEKSLRFANAIETPGRTAAQVVRLIDDLNAQLENDAIDPKTVRARLYAPRTMLVAMKMQATTEPLSRRGLRTPETGPLLEAVAEIPAPRDEPLRELTT